MVGPFLFAVDFIPQEDGSRSQNGSYLSLEVLGRVGFDKLLKLSRPQSLYRPSIHPEASCTVSCRIPLEHDKNTASE